MNTRHTEIVNRIKAGSDPVQAVTEVYQTTPEAASKRLFRILRHSEVYAALQASPVQTPQHPRKLMKGVYVALPGRYAHPADPKDAIRQRLHALLFEAAEPRSSPVRIGPLWRPISGQPTS
jgi:hypothetical protein